MVGKTERVIQTLHLCVGEVERCVCRLLLSSNLIEFGGNLRKVFLVLLVFWGAYFCVSYTVLKYPYLFQILGFGGEILFP